MQTNTYDNIMLSIVMTVYNHAEYIEKAIQSILEQKITYSYEVLIGEDCSTDNTREILKKIEITLPPNFHIYYRESNMGMGPNGNAYDLYQRAIGKYVIALEGDDFWINPQKLQRQISYLENNNDYIAVAHNTLVVDDKGTRRTDYVYPECKTTNYSFQDYANEILAGQLTTVMRRNPNNLIGYKDYTSKVKFAGDQKMNFVLLCNGKVKCIQEIWSAYRYVPEHGTSYSAVLKEDDEFCLRRLHFYEELWNFSKKISCDEAIKTSELLYTYYGVKYILHKPSEIAIFRKLMAITSSSCHKMAILKYLNHRLIKAIRKRNIKGIRKKGTL